MVPFILRNVTLAGIDFVNAPQPDRLLAWSRLATDLDLDKRASATSVVALADRRAWSRSTLTEMGRAGR